MVIVFDIKQGSPAAEAGILAGDYIVAINGHLINDILDYSFYMTEKKVRIRIHRGPDLFDVIIKKEQYEDLGIEFETFLMDDQKHCNNKCVFCFIDQLPPGLRESLYFKDDDSRMSFISGSYITLTNLDESDIDRIIMMRTSPMNISVHTTNPNLRMKMLNNRFAGNVVEVMKKFIDAGIKINCQIVLCKGLNDGRELNSTMETLAGLYPGVESVAVVPAGLTKYREGLYPIEPYTDLECKKIIRQVEKFAEKCKEDFGTRLFYCADELYIKADVNLPKYEDYEDFNQLENGVGLIAEFKAEFDKELKNIKKYKDAPYRQVSIATGEAAYDFISYLVKRLLESCDNLSCTVYKIKNEFFGDNITVAGLVTGQDIARQLHLQPLGEKLFIPSVMLRYERDMFLDSMTVKELSRVLDIEVVVVECNGEEFIKALFA